MFSSFKATCNNAREREREKEREWSCSTKERAGLSVSLKLFSLWRGEAGAISGADHYVELTPSIETLKDEKAFRRVWGSMRLRDPLRQRNAAAEQSQPILHDLDADDLHPLHSPRIYLKTTQHFRFSDWGERFSDTFSLTSIIAMISLSCHYLVM